jgi:hypothetical protein
MCTCRERDYGVTYRNREVLLVIYTENKPSAKYAHRWGGKIQEQFIKITFTDFMTKEMWLRNTYVARETPGFGGTQS